MRLNNSSCQVYMALKTGEQLDESLGDLLFSSTAPLFRTDAAVEPRHHQPHVFVLLPAHPARGSDRSLVVSSTNARYDDWASLSPEEYEASKRDLVETTLEAIAKYVPDIREQAGPRRGLDAA